MVTTRGGAKTAYVKEPLSSRQVKSRAKKANKANATIRRQGMGKDASYKSSQWANGGPKYFGERGVKYLAMTKKKRKNLYSRTPAGARVASACRTYKKGDKRRCHGKKIEGARKHVCGGGVHVCGYGKKSKKGKWHTVKNYCKSN